MKFDESEYHIIKPPPRFEGEGNTPYQIVSPKTKFKAMNKLRIIASKSGNHVVFFQTTFSKSGFASGTLIGAVEFDPAKYKTVGDAVEAAKKLQWELEPKEGTDFCNVIEL